MSRLSDLLKKDDQYKKYRNVFKTVKQRLDIEKDLNEVLSLHAGRHSRALYGDKQFSSRAIYTATSQDLSIRARLVEIRQQTSVQISFLRGAMERLHKYIRTEYKMEMRQFTNEQTRRATLDGITHTGYTLISETDSLIDTIDNIIKDIDQAGHSIRHMISILQLLDSSKGKNI